MTKTSIMSIVAVFSCLAIFAQPYKSSLAAFSIAKNKIDSNQITARDYIQDSLICLYDGIENQGFGKHREGIGLPWVDCISGVQISQTYQNRVGLYRDGVGCAIGNGPVIPLPPEVPTMTEWTVEYCANMAVGFGATASFIRGYRNIKTYYPNMQWYVPSVASMILAGGYGYGLSIENTENKTMYSFFRMSSASHIAGLTLLGDENISTRTGIAPWGQFENDSLYMADYSKDDGYIMRIKCIRIYNRPLSDEEIQYNYRIDCERFKE